MCSDVPESTDPKLAWYFGDSDSIIVFYVGVGGIRPYSQILLATLFFVVNWGTDEESKRFFEKFAFLAVCCPKNPQKSPENGKFDEKRHFSNIYTIIFSLLIIFLVSIGILMKDQKNILKNLEFWRFAAPKTLKNHPKIANLMKNVILVIFTQSYSAYSSFFFGVNWDTDEG